MLISVIIPNYNHGMFLKQRLESILKQSWTKFEVIILDDCSSDASRDIIEEFRDCPKVSQIVYNDTNSGSPFKQWKKGMELANGELVWIAESDDYCELTLLEKLIKPFMEDKNCVLSFCASDKVDLQGLSHGIHENQSDIPAMFIDGNEFNHKYMWHNAVVNASSALFKRDLGLSMNNGYDTLGGYGDYLFWIGMAACGRVYYTTEILNHFRFHESNTTALMHSSSKGIHETIITDNFLYNNGIIDRRQLFSRNLSSAYRLKYIYCEKYPFEGIFFNIALTCKRIYRLLSRKK